MAFGWQGTWTALVTPFREDGSLDLDGLESLVDGQIAEGIEGLVACGSTGEASMLTPFEWESVVEATARVARGRVPVLAGTGTSDTRETCRRTARAEALGANGALVVTPPYVKPPQEGLVRHFVEVAASSDLPLVLYNVPSRTGGRLEAETIVRLAEVPRIAAIKEASGDLRLVSTVLGSTDLPLLSGDDELTLPILSLGGKGVVSVVSNLVPREMGDLVRTYLAGDSSRSRSIHHSLLPLFRAMSLDTNPVPVKAALALRCRIKATVRLPLVTLPEKKVEELRNLLDRSRHSWIEANPSQESR